MRNRVILVGSMALLFSCDDGTSTAPSTSAADAGGTGGAGSSTSGEQSSSSGMPTLERVRVRGYESGAAIANFPIFTFDSEGHVEEELATDANGEVQLDVPLGGGVGVLSLYATTNQGKLELYRSINTYYGVPEAGKIAVAVAEPTPQVAIPPENSPMSLVKVYATSMPATAQTWVASLSCDAGALATAATASINFTNFEGCRGSAKFDALVYALDANGSMVGFGHAEGFDHVPGGQTSIMLALSNSELQAQFTGSMTNIEAGSHRARLEVGNYEDVIGFSLTNDQSPPPAQLALTSALPLDYGDTWYRSATVYFDEEGTSTLRRNATSKSFPTTAFQVDASEYARIDSVFENLSEWAHLPIEWKVSGGVTGADATVVSETWYRPNTTTYWTATAPPGTGRVALPDLPANYADWALQPGDYIIGAYVTQVWDSSDGYPAFLDAIPDYSEYDQTVSTRSAVTN